MAGIDPLGGVGAAPPAASAAQAAAGTGRRGPRRRRRARSAGRAARAASRGVGGTRPGADSFLDSLGDALNGLNTQLNTADASMASFASGGSADLHTVMLELQQASIGLKTGIAVRDKLLEAYQELMRLQI